MLRAGTPLKTSPDAAEESGPAPKSARQPAAPQDRERALRLMKKGDALLEDGDVSAARLFFERAADAGLAEAAMALAATYDKAEIERLKLRGILPDAKEARRWYDRARLLGASGAEARLRQIDAK
jgi:TPR repeat protein